MHKNLLACLPPILAFVHDKIAPTREQVRAATDRGVVGVATAGLRSSFSNLNRSRVLLNESRMFLESQGHAAGERSVLWACNEVDGEGKYEHIVRFQFFTMHVILLCCSLVRNMDLRLFPVT